MKNIFTLLAFISFSNAVNSQTADFTFQSTSGLNCTPATIRFTSTTTGNPTGYVWNFGNNSGSNAPNPSATYTSAGTFTVRLIVIYKKKTVQVSKTIVINPAIVAHFVYDRNNLCIPGPVHFTATVNDIISSYQWNFGDNTPPVSTSAPSITHLFANFGTYSISLKATAATGCSSQSFNTVIVDQPSISAVVSPVSGCIPATANFNATVGLPPSATVTNYIWDFGDGSTATTTTAHTTHTYNTTGNFTPKLHILTNEGCSNDFVLQKVAFGIPPTNHIAYPEKTIFCGSESPAFVSKATNSNKYLWDFGQGDTTSVTDTVIRHKFRTLGTKTVTVTPMFNNCPGTPISFIVNVIGVIAGFDYSNTCSDKKTFAFTDISQGNESTIEWNTGDGSPLLHTNNFVHTFPDTGTFVTKLSITDNITGCADVNITNIYTANPLLTNPDSSVCKNSNTTFSIPRNYNNPDALYVWNVAGLHMGPGNTVPMTIKANVLGKFSNNFVIIDNGRQYCPDTIKLKNSFWVRGPLLDFNAPAELCLSQSYNITNSSRPFFPEDLIRLWSWNYSLPGLGYDSTDFSTGFQPQPFKFPYWALPFKIKLTATDMNGCSDTLVKPVMVYDIPFLRSIPDVDTLCSGHSATLVAFHNDPITWSPANASLSCASCDTVVVNPSVSTTYYVKATNRFNCSVTDSIAMYVYPRFTAEAVKPENYICANEYVKLGVKPSGKIVRWSPAGSLSDSTSYDPIAFPKQNTVYDVLLSDSVGCFSSSTQVSVHVKSSPTVDAGPNKVYPYNTGYSFTPIYSNNVSSYTWSPARLLTCSNCAIPNGIASNSETYTVTVTSDSGCVATDKVSVFVECKGADLLLPTAFTPNRDNLNDYYYPITRGIKKVTRFSIYNRQGQLVYDAKDLMPNHKQAGWDGNVKGLPQASAVFIYTVEAICEAGETLYDKGSFVLIR
ncbi:MAG: PKD domain-containing protein [Ferruginibacter sp.]